MNINKGNTKIFINKDLFNGELTKDNLEFNERFKINKGRR